MNHVMIQRHLEADTSRFLLKRRASGPVWEDEILHESAFEQEPDLYALQALSEAVQTGQRMRVAYQLLRSSCETLSADARQTIDRAVRVLLALTPADDVLTVFLALRRARAGRSHATRHMLRYILNHPRLEDLARRRRRAVVDCLEHAIGRNVARGCAKIIHEGNAADRYVVRHLLRFAADTRRAASAVEWLYYKDTLPALPAMAGGDGYENAASGDLARVVATLPTIGAETPVVFCHGKFTENDNLDYRRPAPSLPEVGFWHERDFRDVLWTVFSTASGGAGRRFLRDVLSKRLTDCEAEVCV